MCLVHENQDCIIDLVRNLRFLDPESTILLYNGGTDKELFAHFPFERYGVVIHPNPKPLKWGWLHDFAIDCMEYALEHLEFDLITVVDSDQLGCGKEYSQFVTQAFLSDPKFGMFGQVPKKLPLDTEIHPAVTAYKEKALWQDFMETLPNGKDAFLHWTFWPSTAFSAKVSKELVKLFRTNIMLQGLLKQTSIWASEEILLPTLTVALGYHILQNPCDYTYVQYKKNYSLTDIQNAINKTDAFWIHPVDRKINNQNRVNVRMRLDNYVHQSPLSNASSYQSLIPEIQDKTTGIEGWISSDELALLVTVTGDLIQSIAHPKIVEVGSYCGKSTAILGLTAQQLNPNTRITAIDEFNGRLGAEDTRIDHFPSSFEKFSRTMHFLNLDAQVRAIRGNTSHVTIEGTIDLLLIDGLHDYANVSRDFYRFEQQVNPSGYILFHDFSNHFPGVKAFVEECVNSGDYTVVKSSSSLICIQRSPDAPPFSRAIATMATKPMVSCIMPTYNRHQLLSKAIEQFLEQDYENKELIIIDDSDVQFSSHLLDHSNITYVFSSNRSSIGAKRNQACQMASGSVIVHLDDDDLYGSDWLTAQVTFLLQNQLDVTGLNTPYFFHSGSADFWQYTYPENQKPWVYGATLCYTKKFWSTNQFPETSCGEDNHFVWNNDRVKLLACSSLHSYLGNIHARNTSPKELKDQRWRKLAPDQIPARIDEMKKTKSVDLACN